MARRRNVMITLAIVVLGVASALSSGGIGATGASRHGQARVVHNDPTGYLARALPTPDPTPTPMLPTPVAAPTPTPHDRMLSGDGW